MFFDDIIRVCGLREQIEKLFELVYCGFKGVNEVVGSVVWTGINWDIVDGGFQCLRADIWVWCGFADRLYVPVAQIFEIVHRSYGRRRRRRRRWRRRRRRRWA